MIISFMKEKSPGNLFTRDFFKIYGYILLLTKRCVEARNSLPGAM